MNLLCTEFSDPEWIEVIGRVVAKTGARALYWTGAASRESIVRARFPNVIFHENLLAVRGVPTDDWQPSVQHSPDGRTLDALLPYQAMALKMMDRMDPSGSSFSYEERLRHYHRLVSYWGATLDELKVDAVLMPIAPHMVYDFVLYGLCKIRNIPTLLFDRTALPGMVLAMDSYAGGSPALRARYYERMASPEPVTLSDESTAYLKRLRGNFNQGMAPNFKLKMSRLGLSSEKGIAKPSLFHIIKHEMKGIYQNLLRQRLRVPRTYVKVKGLAPEDGTVGHFGYYLNRWRGILTKRVLMKQYERLQVNPDLNVPYIFVALHFQPERNTVPIGGHYADQLLLVAQLSRALPAGWKIYVKEHSWQLQPYSRGQHGRTAWFYSDVAALPNVQLIPMGMSSFDLIDRSRAVASVSGSVGWEGVNRGKPALIFGDAWYQACAGVYRVDTEQALEAAMRAVVAGVQVEPVSIEKFVAALEDVALQAVLEFNLEAHGGVTPEQNRTSLANSFIERLKRYKKG